MSTRSKPTDATDATATDATSAPVAEIQKDVATAAALTKLKQLVESFQQLPESSPFLKPVDWKTLELWDYPDEIKHPMDLGTVATKLSQHQYTTPQECALDLRRIWQNCMTYNEEESDLWIKADSLSRRFEQEYQEIAQEFSFDPNVQDEDEEEDSEETAQDTVKSSHPATKDNIAAAHSTTGRNDKIDTNTTNKRKRQAVENKPSANGSGRAKAASGSHAARARTSISFHDKKILASNLLLLSGVEMNHILSIVQAECPLALEDLDSHQQHHDQDRYPAFSCHPYQRTELVLDDLNVPVFVQISKYAAEKARARKMANMPTAFHHDSNHRTVSNSSSSHRAKERRR